MPASYAIRFIEIVFSIETMLNSFRICVVNDLETVCLQLVNKESIPTLFKLFETFVNYILNKCIFECQMR